MTRPYLTDPIMGSSTTGLKHIRMEIRWRRTGINKQFCVRIMLAHSLLVDALVSLRLYFKENHANMILLSTAKSFHSMFLYCFYFTYLSGSVFPLACLVANLWVIYSSREHYFLFCYLYFF